MNNSHKAKLTVQIGFFLALIMAVCRPAAYAQKFSKAPVSPGDVAYFPANEPFEGKPAPLIRVVYFRPLKKGREIFGKMLPYGKVWRAGANNETEIKFFKDVSIGGTSIPAGTYSLFVVPEEKEWTVIINKQTDRWGAYSYDDKLDVVRVKVPVKKTDAPLEAFSIMFNPSSTGATMLMGWDNSFAELPVNI